MNNQMHPMPGWYVSVRLVVVDMPGRTEPHRGSPTLGPMTWRRARRLVERWEMEFGPGTAALRELESPYRRAV